MNQETLKHNLDSIRVMADLQPFEGKTFCNLALRRTFDLCGHPNVLMANEMANAIANQLESDKRFRAVGSKEAWTSANEGHLVVTAHKYNAHGHVAMIYPSEVMGHSVSWQKDVPYVSNVGHTVGIMTVSKAFPVSLGEPEYYVFEG